MKLEGNMPVFPLSIPSHQPSSTCTRQKQKKKGRDFNISNTSQSYIIYMIFNNNDRNDFEQFVLVSGTREHGIGSKP